jgi:hypothetical protein
VAGGGISWRRRCLAAAPWGGSRAGGRGSGRRAGEEGHRAWEEGRRRLLDLVEEEVSWGGGVGRALGAAHQRWEGRDLRRGPPPTGWEGRQRARRDPGGGRGWRERRGRCRGVAGRRGLCGGGVRVSGLYTMNGSPPPHRGILRTAEIEEGGGGAAGGAGRGRDRIGALCRALTARHTTNNIRCRAFFNSAHDKQLFQQFYKIHKNYQISLKK